MQYHYYQIPKHFIDSYGIYLDIKKARWRPTIIFDRNIGYSKINMNYYPVRCLFTYVNSWPLNEVGLNCARLLCVLFLFPINTHLGVRVPGCKPVDAESPLYALFCSILGRDLGLWVLVSRGILEPTPHEYWGGQRLYVHVWLCGDWCS